MFQKEMKYGIGRRSLIVGAGSLLAAPAIVRAEGQSGVALVIGNSKYQWEASLPNVKRDAPDIAKAFLALGLKTELLQDAGKDAMLAAIEKFKAAAGGANLAAFYFAGHGASWDKDTYLVPADADLGNPETVRTLLPVTSISAAMKGAAHRLLVFDNCRNNPADGWRQRAAMANARVIAEEQIAATLTEPNTLTIFSTAPGRVALDGPAGENSPFAAEFLRQIEGDSINLQALPTQLRRDLLITTQGRQVVWDQSTYAGAFRLSGPGKRRSNSARDDAVLGRAPPSSIFEIVELPNAYAFANKNNLNLPTGLVALRPTGDSPYSRMIGAFGFDMTVTYGLYAESIEPVIVLVLTVAADGIAQAIFARRAAEGRIARPWDLLTRSVSKDKLDFPCMTSGRVTCGNPGGGELHT